MLKVGAETGLEAAKTVENSQRNDLDPLLLVLRGTIFCFGTKTFARIAIWENFCQEQRNIRRRRRPENLGVWVVNLMDLIDTFCCINRKPQKNSRLRRASSWGVLFSNTGTTIVNDSLTKVLLTFRAKSNQIVP